jgi:hypothetical protein
LTTVVVLPTPPFWFVQAVTRTTSAPLQVQMGTHILPVSGLTGGLRNAYWALPGRVIHTDVSREIIAFVRN